MCTGRDLLLAGLATHYCNASRISELEASLVSCSNASDIEATLSEYCPVDQKTLFTLNPQLGKINDCFSGESVEEILNKLETDNSEWARRLLKVNVCFYKCTTLSYCYLKDSTRRFAIEPQGNAQANSRRSSFEAG